MHGTHLQMKLVICLTCNLCHTLCKAECCIHPHSHWYVVFSIVFLGVISPHSEPNVGSDCCCTLSAIQEADENGHQRPHSFHIFQINLEFHLKKNEAGVNILVLQLSQTLTCLQNNSFFISSVYSILIHIYFKSTQSTDPARLCSLSLDELLHFGLLLLLWRLPMLPLAEATLTYGFRPWVLQLIRHDADLSVRGDKQQKNHKPQIYELDSRSIYHI